MANLVELFDNIVQMQNLNGVPLAAGKLYVYALGRTRLMDSWSDVDGESLNPNPIILDDAGQCHCYVSDSFDYTLVVCDQYNNEIFSLDKYLYSKGSHSHADVAVAPSESIAVSSYHVGECTVYVPYLTGQLGKVYEGIDPIVVNNQVDKISANHVPLGVQDPLYFVQDDEEGCIIGCSAQTEIPVELSGKWDNAADAVIANSAQWAEETEYEAGNYISITDNTISVTGLQPEGDYAYNSALSSKLDVTALPQDLVHSGDLTAYQPVGDYQTAGNYLSATDSANFYPINNPSGFITGVDLTDYATTAQLDEKLDKSDSGNFYPMEGNPSGFLTAHQSLQGYATEDWVTGQGYLTAHQSLDGLMSADLLEISDNKITGYNGTAFAGQGGGVTGDYELSAGSGISIVDYPLEQKTVISVTAQGGNPEVEQAVIDNSATWNTVSDKLNTTAFSDVSGTFLTAHQDLSDYQTIAGMTAYQPAGAYLTTGDSANFYTTANESGFISEVPAGTMNESAFGYDANDNITGYNGSAFKAGDEFPQSATEAIGYVTATSGDINATIDNVSSNSGAWGGNAIPVSAGEGVKVDYTNGMLVFKQDRTLLYSGNTMVSQWTASEPLTNFEKIEFTIAPETNQECATTILYPMVGINTGAVRLAWAGTFAGWRDILWQYKYNTNDMMAFTGISGNYWGINDAGNTGQGSWNAGSLTVYTVYGLNRKV